jgi:hypothetical protein
VPSNTVSIAGLPAMSACVLVGPPLSAKVGLRMALSRWAKTIPGFRLTIFTILAPTLVLAKRQRSISTMMVGLRPALGLRPVLGLLERCCRLS